MRPTHGASCCGTDDRGDLASVRGGIAGGPALVGEPGGPHDAIHVGAIQGGQPVDRQMRRNAVSIYSGAMSKQSVSLEDLPWGDEQVIRAHAAELIAMAERLGLDNVRYASGNRVVVTRTDHAALLGIHRLAEEASFAFGYRIRVYSDAVFSNPGVSPDLVAAKPL